MIPIHRLEIVEENRKRSRDLWEDSRLVWIPFQYALRPEQHDSQEEMDRLNALTDWRQDG